MEVTTNCNADCRYCPHTVYRDSWVNAQLSMESFRKLIPAFKHTGMVFLQGWGEPLLHPQFFEMAALAKEASCKVGTTTNGVSADREVLHRMVEHRMDMVAFSLAGVDQTNDRFRRGTSIAKIIVAIDELNNIKNQSNSELPRIHIAYLLLKSGLEGVRMLPKLLEGRGIDQAVISALDFVPCPEFADEAILPKNESEFDEIRRRLDAVAQDGVVRGLDIRYQVSAPRRIRTWCAENVHRSLFVTARAEVSPCVFTALPVKGVSHIVNGREKPYKKLIFGSINEKPLHKIWRDKSYRTFRNALYTDALPLNCTACPKLRTYSN